MKRISLVFLVFAALLVSAKPPIDFEGDYDPALPCRMAREMPFDEMKRAIYKGGRSVQLIAIDAASCKEAPFDVLPFLAALMGARDRQVAARAAAALTSQIYRIFKTQTGFSEVILGQASALVDQLLVIGKDPRLDVDLRVSALVAISRIATFLPVKPVDYSFGFQDEEPLIRGALLATILVPIDKAYLGMLAQLATEDTDPDLRGRAVALLCENALAHGVAEPSGDLKKILKSTLSDGDIKAWSIGSILGCLKRFPVGVASDFVEQALAHPDPAVAEYWKSLD